MTDALASRSKRSQPPRFGLLPPRYSFVLHAGLRDRFTRCPRCDAHTRLRKLPLVIHIEQLAGPRLVTLGKTCRLCIVCEVLIAHEHEVTPLLKASGLATEGEVLNYLVLGTGHVIDQLTLAFQGRTMQIQLRVVAVALSIAFGSVTAACFDRSSADAQEASAALDTFKRMPDGKEWTTANLNVDTDGSYCYEDAELNCRRYGRLYTWDAAQRACQSLRGGWRLPTNDEWQQLARHYGGLMEESDEGGKATYAALLTGGSAGFNGLLGGSRVSGDQPYARLEAHGLYWTASESGATTAWFYNFGKGGQSLNRHRAGNKQMAISVRCVRD